MQMEKDLDLEKAIDMARQSEAVKKQQNTLRSDTSGVKQMDAFSVDSFSKQTARRKRKSLIQQNQKQQCNAIQQPGQDHKTLSVL